MRLLRPLGRHAAGAGRFGFAGQNTYLWDAGLDWSAETTRTLHLSLPANNPATGAPTITSSGDAAVGDVLTAVTDAIADDDGLPDAFTHQWVRQDEDGANPEDITGETGPTYTLGADDVGKRVKVRVEFTDDLDGEEAVESAPFPATGTVSAAADATAPTVESIVRHDPADSPTNADALTWRVTFSEDVANVDAADFAATGTTAALDVAEVTASTVFDVTASGGDLAGLDGPVTLGFAAAQNITDTADTPNTLAETAPTGTDQRTYDVDNTAPTVTIEGVPGTAIADFTATFTFSEPVEKFGLGGIAVTNGAASNLTGSDGDTVYTARIVPASSGAVTVNVDAGAAEDDAGNPSQAGTAARSFYSPASSDMLISNIGQTSDSTADLNTYDIAQAFTTGRHANGYRLSSVEVEFARVSQAVAYSVGIWSSDEDVDSSGDADSLHEPHARLGALTCPTLTVSTAAAVFECTTTGIDLDAETTYLFVVDVGTAVVNQLRTTSSNAEDSGGAAGWSIADNYVFRSFGSGGSWSHWLADQVKIRVNGETRSNTPATGAPAITGTAQAGQTLSAGLGTIADANGLPATFPDDYAFQWIRVDGSDETDIPGATSSTYEPVAADVGKTLKVRVSFTDDAGNDESLTSAATAAVIAAVVTPPPQSPNAVWSATVTVAQSTAANGFGYIAEAHPLPEDELGSITDDDFDLDGTTYTVWRVTRDSAGTGNFRFTVATGATPAVAPLPSTLLNDLSLKITANEGHEDGPDILTLNLSDGTYNDSNSTSIAAIFGYRFSFTDAHFDPDITTGSYRVELIRSGGTTPNNAPTVANPIPDQTATTDTEFTFTVPEDAFADTDTGDTLTYSATLSDASALPSWLTFDTTTRTFTGTPAAGDTGTITVRVTATDGSDASIHDDFDIAVSEAFVCTAPELTGRDVHWTATLTAATNPNNAGETGYDPAPGGTTFGTLNPTTFTIGSTQFTVGKLIHSGNAFIQIVTNLTAEHVAVAKLHICDTELDFSSAIGLPNNEHLFSITDGPLFSAGNEVTVRISTPTPNTPATGAPVISGVAQAGQTLTAGQGTIADADGLPATFPDDYTFQWIQVDGSDESDIAGATSQTYEPVAGDVGKTLKVKVSFQDSNGNDESLTSAAAAAVTAAPTTCAMPDFGTRRQIWTGTVTVGQLVVLDVVTDPGFSDLAYGALDDTDFDIGADSYTINRVTVSSAASAASSTSSPGELVFSLTSALTDTAVAALQLHVCDTAYAFSAATYESSAFPSYVWESVPDWSGETTRTLYLSLPANNAPTVATPIGDQTATADTEFTFTVPEDAFADTDTGDTLTYSATLSDASALPSWLTFDTTTRTFTGTPTTAGTITVRVTATDGSDASIHDDFDIVVSEAFVCTVPELTGRDVHWTSTLTVAANPNNAGQVGYDAAPGGTTFGTLNPTTFTIGSTQFTVGKLIHEGSSFIQIVTDLTAEHVAAAKLHICDTELDFSGAVGLPNNEYLFSITGGPLFSAGNEVTVRISTPTPNSPATGAPAITGVAQAGQTLTAGQGTIADANGLPATFPDDYAFQWIRVDGSDETDIPGATSSTYEPVAADVGKTLKVRVSFQDDAGNDEALTSAATAAVTAAAPGVVSIERHDPTTERTNAGTLVWLVTFSEDVTNVDAGDFNLIRSEILIISAADDVRQVTASTYEVEARVGSRTGTWRLKLTATNDIADVDGNALASRTPTETNDDTFIVDRTRPTVAITGAPEMAGEAYAATFTFSEGVYGFNLSDIVVENGEPSAFMGEEGGTTYTATITPVGSGEVSVNVRADAATDEAGNGNVGTSMDLAPAAALESLTLAATGTGDAIALSPAFAAATQAYSAYAGTADVVTIRATGNGTITFLDEGAMTLADRDGDASNGLQTALEVGENILRIRVEEDTTTREYTITVTRELHSSVAALESLTLAATGTGDAVALSPAFDSATTDYEANAGTAPRVTVSPATADSNATVAYEDGGGTTLADADGISSNGHQVDLAAYENVIRIVVTAENGTTTREYTVTVTREPDTSVMTVEVVSTPPRWRQQSGSNQREIYGAGDRIEFAVTFGAEVDVDETNGTPALAFSLGNDEEREAAYERGSGTSRLVFAYTVQAGDRPGGGNSIFLMRDSAVPGGALALNGAVLRTGGSDGVSRRMPDDLQVSAAGHNADGRRSGPYPESYAATSTPLVTRAGHAQADTYGLGETFEVTLTMSEPVTVTGTPRAALGIGSTKYAEYARGSGTREIVFAYAIEAADDDWISLRDGDLSGSDSAIQLGSGGRIAAASDSARDADLVHPGKGSVTRAEGHRSASELSALTVTETDTGTAIALEPPFDAAVTSYTADARGASGITVSPRTLNSDATVAYLDGNGDAIADEDGVQAGLQTVIAAGENVIRVRVELGPTSREYTLRVTRGQQPGTGMTPGSGEEGILVSNTGQTTHEVLQLAETGTSPTQAQAFTTGGDPEGYVLRSVGLPVESSTSGFSFNLCDVDNEGRPVEPCIALLKAGHTGGEETVTGRPASTTILGANKKYAIYIGASLGEQVAVKVTQSDEEDVPGAPDWSIDDNRLVISAALWAESLSGRSIQISVHGYPARWRETRLRGLEVSGGVREVTQPVPLTPQFSPEGEAFDAGTIGNEKLTIVATAMDEAATVELLDGEDNVLADLDPDPGNGHQAPLDVGENAIRVKVTARSGVETRIYTVTVTRPAQTSRNDFLSRLVLRDAGTSQILYESPDLGAGRLPGRILLPWNTHRITVEPELWHAGAIWLALAPDATLSTIPDADPDTDGYQFDTGYGESIFHLRVIALDGHTFRTYQVRLERPVLASGDCPRPDFQAQYLRHIWTGEVAVEGYEAGGNIVFHGYNKSRNTGSIENPTAVWNGKHYTVKGATVETENGTIPGQLFFGLENITNPREDGGVEDLRVAKAVLHVCDRAMPFRQDDGREWMESGQNGFAWGDAAMDWSSHASRILHLSVPLPNRPGHGEPWIGGVAEVGQTLAAYPLNLRDADGVPGGDESFSYRWERSTPDGYVEIDAASGRRYVLTDTDLGAQVRALVSYTDGRGTMETVATAAYPQGDTVRARSMPTGEMTLSNFGQKARSGPFSFGYDLSGPEPVLHPGLLAQAFSTGPATNGYQVDAIHVQVREAVEVTVKLCGTHAENQYAGAIIRHRAGTPTRQCSAVFAAPPGPFVAGQPQRHTSTGTPFRLSPGTRYAVVMTGPGRYEFDTAEAGRTDAASEPGWTMGGNFMIGRDGAWLFAGQGRSLRMAIEATPAGAPQHAAPEVTGAPELGEAGRHGAWAPADRVTVTMGFSEPVDVVTEEGTPSVEITLGLTEKRRAAYVSGSGTASLTFAYMLGRDDGTHTSIGVTPESLALNGGAIRSSATGAEADLAHQGAAKVAFPAAPSAARQIWFENVPERHPGEDFTVDFRIHPAPAIEDLGFRDVRDNLFVVTGGDLFKAKRIVRGTNGAWRLHLRPSGRGAVTLAAEPLECVTPQALCLDGEPLSQGASVTVHGPLSFVATIEGMPAEHDGERFSFTFTLSHEPDGRLGWWRMQHDVFIVTGGAITRVERTVGGSDRGWRYTLRPEGHEDVRIQRRDWEPCGFRGALCRENGDRLITPFDITVPGPAALSVADAEAQEGAGAALDFVVTLSRARSEATTVAYATADVTATAGEDYQETSGTLAFAAGVTERTVSVAVLDDAHDEGTETLTLTLSDPSPASYVRIADGTATGTIGNDDPMPQAWIARFGRTVAEQVLEAVEGRMRAARAAGAELSLAGQRIGLGPVFGGAGEPSASEDRAAAEAEDEGRRLADWLADGTGGSEGGAQRRLVSGRELLTGSAFALTAAPGGSGGTMALWGRGAVSRFDGRAGDLALDGEVVSGLLGGDWSPGSGTATLGLIVGHSRGEGGWRSASGGGTVVSTLTGVYPWVRRALTERLEVWGAAGYGEGTLTLTPEAGTAARAGLDLMMGAAGVRGVVLAAPAGGPEVAVTADAMGVAVTTARAPDLAAAEADATRLRLGLEGSWPVRLERGASLTPSLALGVRHDGGDAETGYGADVGGGIAWSDPVRGLMAEVRGRGLLSHEASGLRERGLSGALSWEPGTGGRGPRLSLTQTLGGASAGGIEALHGRRTLAGLAADGDGDELRRRRLEARLGYGFSAFGDGFTLTPEAGAGLSDAGRDYTLSWRLSRRGGGDAGSLELALEARRQESANDNGPPRHELGLRVNIRW